VRLAPASGLVRIRSATIRRVFVSYIGMLTSESILRQLLLSMSPSGSCQWVLSNTSFSMHVFSIIYYLWCTIGRARAHTHTHTHTWLFIYIFPDNPQKNLGYPESAAIRQCSRPAFWIYPMYCRLPEVPFASTFFSCSFSTSSHLRMPDQCAISTCPVSCLQHYQHISTCLCCLAT